MVVGTEAKTSREKAHSPRIPCPTCGKPIGKGRQAWHDMVKHRDKFVPLAQLADVTAKLMAAEARTKELEAQVADVKPAGSAIYRMAQPGEVSLTVKPAEVGDTLEGALAVLSDHWTPEAWRLFGERKGYLPEETAEVADVPTTENADKPETVDLVEHIASCPNCRARVNEALKPGLIAGLRAEGYTVTVPMRKVVLGIRKAEVADSTPVVAEPEAKPRRVVLGIRK